MEVSGVTWREPEAGSVPRPAMVISLALLVSHVKTAVWPCWITLGFAAIVAVGATGGGAAGGVTLATFLLQPANENSARSEYSRSKFLQCSLDYHLYPPHAKQIKLVRKKI